MRCMRKESRLATTNVPSAFGGAHKTRFSVLKSTQKPKLLLNPPCSVCVVFDNAIHVCVHTQRTHLVHEENGTIWPMAHRAVVVLVFASAHTHTNTHLPAVTIFTHNASTKNSTRTATTLLNIRFFGGHSPTRALCLVFIVPPRDNRSPCAARLACVSELRARNTKGSSISWPVFGWCVCVCV